VSVALSAQAGDDPSDQELRPEESGLHERTVGQVGAAHPVREPKIVPHERGRAGLAADDLALDNCHAEALRSSVHGCGQPRRAATHDGYIKHGPLPTWVEPQRSNDLQGRR
jgi:hypothetical protein